MVDVAGKERSDRRAVATAVVITTPEVAKLLAEGGLPKGDALAVARIAGVMAAKRTPDLIPLCHPIAISSVTVDLDVDTDEGRVRIAATVGTTDRTGVEMEALTAAAVAGLTVHDMIKGIDPASVMTDVRVERKEGGKTGLWVRDAD
jgi:cyclic pyranopterin monophosphate synthase